ncbi:MAG TPA: ABC transporter permease DevC [Pirellulaceae bacterium]|nr:ABC transporter permease DevC [Pirellulaceae bacterium]
MRFRTPLAWKNLTHDVRRLFVAVSGVAFAVILIFMELGFLNALLESTVQVFRRLKGEIVVVSRAQYALIAAERFDIRRIYDARDVPGVVAVAPVYIESTAALLRTGNNRGFPIRVIAVREEDAALDIPQLAEHHEALHTDAAALADVTTRHKFGFPRPGQPLQTYRGELNGKEVRLVGHFHLGVDFATDGNLLMTAANFARFFPHRAGGDDPLRLVDLAIVRLEPNADINSVLEDLRQTLPTDVVPLTKQRLIEREMTFWKKNAPLGYIFMVGATMGFVVGVVICYQIVYADIADHMREFATLKAIGYGNGFFISLVLQQCLYLSFLGFVPGFIVSFIGYRVLAAITGLTMDLSPQLAASVLCATAAMCVISGLLAVTKLLAADPADLF